MRYEDETASGEEDHAEEDGRGISVKGRKTNPDPDERGRKGTYDRREFIGEPIVEELPISISSTVF